MTIASHHQLFWDCTEKVLNRVPLEIKSKEVLKEVYGDDTSIVGIDMLKSVLDSTLQTVNGTVRDELESYMKAEKVKETLERFELVLEKLQAENEAELAKEAYDQSLAQAALKTAQLPEGVSAEELIRYEQYQKIQKERDEILKELEQEEKELNDLEGTIQKQSQSAQRSVQELANMGQQLQQSANECSMVS